MNILTDVFVELFKMFVTDLRLTIATLAAVVLVALLLAYENLPPLFAGVLLLVLCVAILFEAVFRETRIRTKRH
ncbi:hypothetical protein MNBD_ALPHA12-879 [hydrothermal vent metagenome]|uniref:Uncharacterized protein n=1 Tax=hydrothermal vent metagenome TaxID=652676 RepID=A0A3B0U141_9ZZZZ